MTYDELRVADSEPEIQRAASGAEAQAAIEKVDRRRGAARDDAELRRASSEAAAAVSEAQLRTGRESFRVARM